MRSYFQDFLVVGRQRSCYVMAVRIDMNDLSIYFAIGSI